MSYSVQVVATSAHPLVPLGEGSEPLHWNSPGVDMTPLASEFHIAEAHFDAQRGSFFAVRLASRLGPARADGGPSIAPVGARRIYAVLMPSRRAIARTRQRGHAWRPRLGAPQPCQSLACI